MGVANPQTLLSNPALLILLPTLLVLLTSLRILHLLRSLGHPPRNPPPRGSPVHLLIVLGSGGHTQEMLYMMEKLCQTYKYTFRTYVLSSGDGLSADRARNLETDIEAAEKKRGIVSWREIKAQGKGSVEEAGVECEKGGWPLVGHSGPGTYGIVTVPRARRIHQSLLSTPVSALWCLVGCLRVLLGKGIPIPTSGFEPMDQYDAVAFDYPDVIFCNGPGSAVIMVLASWILRFFDVRGAQSRGKMKVVYVESFARVKSLSLSGRLLVRVVDHFYVQWPQLKGAGGGRAKYAGFLVI